jgi:hypothetical protein
MRYGGGVGGGVIDRCRKLKLPVTEVQIGAATDHGSFLTLIKFKLSSATSINGLCASS